MASCGILVGMLTASGPPLTSDGGGFLGRLDGVPYLDLSESSFVVEAPLAVDAAVCMLEFKLCLAWFL